LNIFTGLASAFCDGVPVIVLAGEVPRRLHGRGALQEGSASTINVVGMAKHITKMALEVHDPASAPAVLQRALATSTSGRRGPVLLSIPLDVSAAEIARPGLSGEVKVEWSVENRLIDKTASSLDQAKRPVIFAGSGSRWDDAPVHLLRLAERLQAPVMTTPKGKGVFPESHPLSLGVFGYGGHPSASQYLARGVDMVLAVGTGLSDPATDGWSPLLHSSEHFVQIDADALQIGRNYPVSLGLVGPAAVVLRSLADRVKDKPVKREFGVVRSLDPEQAAHGAHGQISPARACWELQQAMPRDTIYTGDIGQHLLFAIHYLCIDDPSAFITMLGLASMGSSIGAAIGAKLAAPTRPVVAICGDGAFAMQLGDVATAVKQRLPILVAVLNDRRYGMVELGHQGRYGRSPGFSCDELDITSLARGVGARGVRITRAGELDALALRRLLAAGPVVIDFEIDRDVHMPPIKRFVELAPDPLEVAAQAADASP
jgi:acetolactate synthase-1/2/3 large subunit